ncbi:MAG: hypothetical protein A3G75_05935 [Verrucomicrobia bacterium RIFCSPLOWO2_12_FULL_64_8]|nr:MAG: hypothetical protein A3G75_05935 [Verrucomicrobia bacterium RIFCSPLOWO2_12_FULL_64_8]
MVQRIAVGGILGVQPGIIGCLQALEVIKLITGQGRPLIGRLLVFDGMDSQFREVPVRKDPACPACGEHRTITEELIDYDEFCGIVKQPSPVDPKIGVPELKRRHAQAPPLILLDVREAEELAAGHIPGARSIPLGELLAHVHEFAWGDDIVVYSGDERRSRAAADRLKSLNFRRTRFLGGGYNVWLAQAEKAA